MKPYIFLVSVISAIAATKVFEEVFIMTSGGPRNASKTVVYYVYESAFKRSRHELRLHDWPSAFSHHLGTLFRSASAL